MFSFLGEAPCVVAVARVGDNFFLRLKGKEGKEYYGTDGVSPELKWTKEGDNVIVEVNRGSLSSMPIVRFDNTGLSLSTIED